MQRPVAIKRVCERCGLVSVAGAGRCLRCGGALVGRRRAASPFGGTLRTRLRRRAAWASAFCAAVLVAAALALVFSRSPHHFTPASSPPAKPAAALPSAGAVLPGASTPGRRAIVRLRSAQVQESCVGRPLPGDLETVGGPVAVIDSNPLTSWHCDGDGARARPPQSLAVFFIRTLTLTRVGVIGYDPYRPCRFVTAMSVVIGDVSYRIRLPAVARPQMRWFAVPDVRTSRVTLIVTATVVPPGKHGPNCARTAIAKIGFAVRT